MKRALAAALLLACGAAPTAALASSPSTVLRDTLSVATDSGSVLELDEISGFLRRTGIAPQKDASFEVERLGRLSVDIDNALRRQAGAFESSASFERTPSTTDPRVLFPEFGFEPYSGPISWRFLQKSEHVVHVCYEVPIQAYGDWARFTKTVSRLNLQYTDALCLAPVIPLESVGQLVGKGYAMQVLDRRHVPLPTKIDEGLRIRGVIDNYAHEISSGALIPQALFKASTDMVAPRYTLWITNNTASEVLEVTGAYADPGWSFENNNCDMVYQGYSCTVDVRFTASAALPRLLAGRAWLRFDSVESNPAVTPQVYQASITVAGERLRNNASEVIPATPGVALETDPSTAPNMPPESAQECAQLKANQARLRWWRQMICLFLPQVCAKLPALPPAPTCDSR